MRWCRYFASAKRVGEQGNRAGWDGMRDRARDRRKIQGSGQLLRGLAEQKGYSFVVFLQESLGLLSELHTLVLRG